MQATLNEQYGALSQFLPVVYEAPADRRFPSVETRMEPFRLLIMEASVPLARLLATGLKADCSSIEVTHDFKSALEKLEEFPSEMLILDLDGRDLDARVLDERDPGMAEMDGPRLLRSLRAKRPELRILALSRRSGTEEMARALDNGADDYVTKPFSLIELMARIRALRRRSQTVARTPAAKGASLVLHREQCRVERDGRFIDLTPRELTLLDYLMQHAGQTLSRAVLTQEVWNMPFEGNTNIVDVYIKYLRDKLDGDYDVKLIRTVRGIGYSYQATT